MKSINLPTIAYILPFTYFVKSRLTSLKDWVFHSWNEWLVNFLLVFYISGYDLSYALKSFFIGYIAFISFYEIGYIVNDFYAVKKEAAPRYRFGKQPVTQAMLWLWVIARVAFFVAITYYLNFPSDWLLFYLGLAIVFALHNIITSRALKTFTFLQLAIFRFWAPVFYFIPKEYIVTLFPIVFFYYVFNRTLTYMDSKSLLQLPERTSLDFKIGSSFILLIFTLFWSYFMNSWSVALLAVYFTLFWVCVKVLGKNFSSTL